MQLMNEDVCYLKYMQLGDSSHVHVFEESLNKKDTVERYLKKECMCPPQKYLTNIIENLKPCFPLFQTLIALLILADKFHTTQKLHGSEMCNGKPLQNPHP